MATVNPFRGLRPNPTLVTQVVSPPYDVLDSDEARELAAENSNSFLHVIKPEIDLPPETDPYSDAVYQKGAENLQKLRNEHILLQEEEPCYYLYQQVMGDHVQTGFVGCASVNEYIEGKIKKHEHTRPEKVNDRVKLMSALNAQTGPVFLAYRLTDDMAALVDTLLQKCLKVYEFTSFYDVRHIFYKVDADSLNQRVRTAFANLPALYIADGHHRSEGASVFCQNRRKEQPNYNGSEEFNFFLTVIFPHDDLYIFPYNRVVKDLNGLTSEQFLEKISASFSIEKSSATFQGVKSAKTYGMYLDNSWYLLTAKSNIYDENDAVERLDVAILQNNLLGPILDIDDPRTNKRIDFIGGIKGDVELKHLVDSGRYSVAFSLYPTSMEEVMDVADAGKVMPPKSTWFEPKLLSGLVTHLLD